MDPFAVIKVPDIFTHIPHDVRDIYQALYDDKTVRYICSTKIDTEMRFYIKRQGEPLCHIEKEVHTLNCETNTKSVSGFNGNGLPFIKLMCSFSVLSAHTFFNEGKVKHKVFFGNRKKSGIEYYNPWSGEFHDITKTLEIDIPYNRIKNVFKYYIGYDEYYGIIFKTIHLNEDSETEDEEIDDSD
ncbi:hypothetical protein AGMMS49579_26560 [Spirochaetia bacterium]|nr:hypothetical protein AGMMS49579_26560 [Spirochaetia bacterium]